MLKEAVVEYFKVRYCPDIYLDGLRETIKIPVFKPKFAREYETYFSTLANKTVF
jgi:hypothetical protein